MSIFEEFGKSRWLGQAVVEQRQLKEEETLRTLPEAVGQIFQRLCAYYQCPRDRAYYLDLDTATVAGPVQDSVPPLRYQADSGRYGLGLEIRVGEDRYPVWLHFDVALLEHGGFEIHFDSSLFQIPAEEGPFCNEVAQVINQELRLGPTATPLQIGFSGTSGNPGMRERTGH